MIKVWDYKKEYDNIREDVLEAVDSVFSGGTLVFGPRVEEFEDKFATYQDSKFGIGVGNCTDALYITMKALGIGDGDEVITVSNTAVPTCTAIAMTGAEPVFVDIDEYSLMDVSKIEEEITDKTKAILPVHLFGQMCDMDVIMDIAKRYDLKLLKIVHNHMELLIKEENVVLLVMLDVFHFIQQRYLVLMETVVLLQQMTKSYMIR